MQTMGPQDIFCGETQNSWKASLTKKHAPSIYPMRRYLPSYIRTPLYILGNSIICNKITSIMETGKASLKGLPLGNQRTPPIK